MEQTPSLWLLSAYLLLLAVLLWALWALWRWGHIVLYALDYAYIKLRVWWFVRQRYTVVDMFEVDTHTHTTDTTPPNALHLTCHIHSSHRPAPLLLPFLSF